MNNRKEFEEKVDFALNDSNITSFQYKIIQDVAWILKNDYNVDEDQILNNLCNLKSIQVVDKDFKSDWTGVLNIAEDGIMRIRYKDVDDEIEKRGVLTHELIHCIATNKFENGFNTGFRIEEKYRFFNEIITESLAKEVMEKMGYELDGDKRGYFAIIDYGDALLKTDLREEIIEQYFNKEKPILENLRDSGFAVGLSSAWNSQIYDDLNLSNNTNLLHKTFIDFVKNNDIFSKEKMSESEYSEIIGNLSNDNFKRLNLSEEDIRVLNYNRYSNGIDVNINEYLNKDSNFNISLDVIRDIQKKFPGEEIDLKTIRFVSIEEDDQKKIVYSFNEKKYVVGSNYTQEVSFDGKLTDKIFKNNGFLKTFKDEFSSVNFSEIGFKNFADIFRETSWQVYMNKDLKKFSQDFSSFLVCGKVTSDLLSINKLHDKEGNNILHFIGYNNNHLKNNGNIELDRDLGFKDIANFRRMMSERNQDGLTPFDEAVKSKNVAIIKFYSEKIEEYKIKGFTSGNLNFDENISILKYMLKEDNLNKNYKSIVNFIKTFEIDQNGQKLTPLEIMVQENVVNGKILKEISSDSFNFETSRGNLLTYLTATKDENATFVKHLLNREDINVNSENKENHRMPLHNLLYGTRNEEIIDMLIKAGADVNAKCIENLNDIEINKSSVISYITPVQIAYGMSDGEIDYKIVELLVKAGADVKAETNMYPSVLETMHEKGDIEGLKALINAGMSSKEIIDDYKSNSNVSENDLKDLVKYEAETKSHLNIDKEDVKDKSVNADIDMEM